MRALNCPSDSVTLWCWNQFVIKKSSVEDYLDREREDGSGHRHPGVMEQLLRSLRDPWRLQGRHVAEKYAEPTVSSEQLQNAGLMGRRF